MVLVLSLVVVLVLAGFVYGVVVFNRLVRRRNQVQAASAQIDVQLRRRHDLIPSLVETVKGYAGHERATLEAVVAARQGAVASDSAPPAARAAAENTLTRSLGRLFAISEAYPVLKADENFLQLQAELTVCEDKIAYARQFFNSAVQTLNTTVESVPSNVVARVTGFHRHDYFEASGDERAAVGVRF